MTPKRKTVKEALLRVKCFQLPLSFYADEHKEAEKELSQNLDALDLDVAAIEKQIPKKLSTAKGYYHDYLVCPVCGRRLRVAEYSITWDKRPRYCEYCGQFLDWGDDE